jgi:hypothetical protein
MDATYRYRPAVLDQLLGHGLRPGAHTPPRRLRAQVNDLYRFELRRLRARLLSGDFPKRDYASHVVGLRRRYPLLSLPDRLWTE